MKHAELRFPEQIEKAQVAIFIGGSEGTFGARNWVYWARKPVMGVPRFGGSGETIYQQELTRRLQKSQLAAADYERLNAVRSRMPWYARRSVKFSFSRLYERIKSTRRNAFYRELKTRYGIQRL